MVDVEVQREPQACGPRDDAPDGWRCRPWDCSRPAECPMPMSERAIADDLFGGGEGIPTGAERLRAMLEAVGEGELCGASCACHGSVSCLLAAGHAHGDSVTREDGSTDTDTHPHVGIDAGGNLVQWEHTGAHGPVQTEAQVSESQAAAKRAHTFAVLDGLDLDVLREMTTPNAAGAKDGARS